MSPGGLGCWGAGPTGITTFFCILYLDLILWNDNINAGIIAHTLDDASNIFKDKLRYAFEHLDPRIRAAFKPIGESAKELSFAHGSTIRVGTSLRSSTLQYLHISEFGKICAKYPERGREIITGSLNTVHAGQYISIESTAEGKEGYFHDMVVEARAKDNKNLSPLDFKFFFFPWWKHHEYTIGVETEISSNLKEYYDKLSLEGVRLSNPQKWWYAQKSKSQKEDMKREFPSTPDEAFSASQDGYWYASYLKDLYEGGHVCNVSYDRAIPVHTAWDLGQADMMAIWFFQINRSGDINIIDFWQKNNTPLDQISIMLKLKGYNYGTHIWPHDAASRDRAGITFVQQCAPLGLYGIVLEPHAFMHGINLSKTTLSKCWFDRTKCSEGLRLLENYKKKWSSSFGGWTSEAVHDDCSHCFVGDTMILTDYGMCQIMHLKPTGKVWTALGWKSYHGARVTRKNAEVVEITFEDGMRVKCTPDHLFLRENGWQYAKDLRKGSKIQSSLTILLNFLEGWYTASGPARSTVLGSEKDFIEMFGKVLLDLFQEGTISITETPIRKIIDWRIWNLLKEVSIYLKNGKGSRETIQFISQKNVETGQENGINPMKEEENIPKLLYGVNLGRSEEELKNNVYGVENPFKDWIETEETLRDFVSQIAKQLTVVNIEKIKKKENVWCLTVPGVSHFSLANGAIVHNCADAFRYLCAGVDKIIGSSGGVEKDMSILRKYWG